MEHVITQMKDYQTK